MSKSTLLTLSLLLMSSMGLAAAPTPSKAAKVTKSQKAVDTQAIAPLTAPELQLPPSPLTESTPAPQVAPTPESLATEVSTPESSPSKSIGEHARSALKAVSPVSNPRLGAEYLVTVNYSPLEFPIPNKFGGTIGMIKTDRQTWELEYLNSSLSVPGGFRSLGGISDTRVSVIGRTYFGNSFHLSYGLSHFDMKAKLGEGLMNRVTNGAYPSMEIMRIQSLGFTAGMGNVWTFRHNITLGVDWINWSQPLMYTERSSDYQKYATSWSNNAFFDETKKILTYLPRLSVLNLHVGMLF